MDTSLSFLYSYCELTEALSELGYSKQSQKRFINKNRLCSKVTIGKEFVLPLDLLNQNLINPIYNGPEVKVLHDDHDFLVLSKPATIHSLGQRYSDQNTLLNFLRAHRPELLKVGCENPARGFLYRLDQETSGLMIYCKKQDKWDYLRKNFHQEVTCKEYLAVVQGEFLSEGEHTHSLQPWGPKGAKMKVSDKGLPGKSMMSLVKIFEGKSLVKITLETGLRHQIRVQLSALGYPIIGDPIYGEENPERMLLHCWRYKISGNQFQDNSFLDYLTSSTKTVF